MKTLLSRLLRPLLAFNSKPVVFTIALLLAICIYEYLLLRDRKQELEALTLAYKNPQIKEVVKTVKVKGPVRVEYRKIIETVQGEKEIVERIVYKEPEFSLTDSNKESVPLLSKLNQRKDRFLLGASRTDFGTNGGFNSIHAGYSFQNRVDLIGGVSVEAEPQYTVQALLRL